MLIYLPVLSAIKSTYCEPMNQVNMVPRYHWVSKVVLWALGSGPKGDYLWCNHLFIYFFFFPHLILTWFWRCGKYLAILYFLPSSITVFFLMLWLCHLFEEDEHVSRISETFTASLLPSWCHWAVCYLIYSILDLNYRTMQSDHFGCHLCKTPCDSLKLRTTK